MTDDVSAKLDELHAEIKALRQEQATTRRVISAAAMRHRWARHLVSDLETNPHTQYKVHLYGVIYWLINFPAVCYRARPRGHPGQLPPRQAHLPAASRRARAEEPRLAKRLAKKTDALLLASATPHNGDARSFAELIDMLDPAAIADDRNYAAKDIAHLYIRRTKISQEVTNEIGGKWRERGPSQAIRCPASQAEEDVFSELTRVWLADPSVAPGAGTDRRLFPYTLLKTFLSSHKALAVPAVTPE